MKMFGNYNYFPFIFFHTSTQHPTLASPIPLPQHPKLGEES